MALGGTGTKGLSDQTTRLIRVTDDTALIYTNQLCGDPGHDALLHATPSVSSFFDEIGDGTILDEFNPLSFLEDFEAIHPLYDCFYDTSFPYYPDSTGTVSETGAQLMEMDPEYTLDRTFPGVYLPGYVPPGGCTSASSAAFFSDGYSTRAGIGDVMSSSNVTSDEHSRTTFSRTPRKRPTTRKGRSLSQNRGSGVRKVAVRQVAEPCMSETGAVTSQKPKGVTMLYRTLLRKLLAGSGWIMDSSISKENAKKLIKILMGRELVTDLNVDRVLEDAERVPPLRKEEKCNRLLADMMSCYVDATVTVSNADFYIRRLKGPYRLVEEFTQLLEERSWPPYMPSESDMRCFGCYLEGEGNSL